MEKAPKTASWQSRPVLSPQGAVGSVLVLGNCVNALEMNRGYWSICLYYHIKLISLGLKSPYINNSAPNSGRRAPQRSA